MIGDTKHNQSHCSIVAYFTAFHIAYCELLFNECKLLFDDSCVIKASPNSDWWPVASNTIQSIGCRWLWKYSNPKWSRLASLPSPLAYVRWLSLGAVSYAFRLLILTRSLTMEETVLPSFRDAFPGAEACNA